MVFFRSIGESEFENMHLARLWREGSPERQLVALSAELRRSGLLLKNTIDSPSPFQKNYKKVYFLCKVYLSVRRISRYTMVTVIFTDAVYRVFC